MGGRILAAEQEGAYALKMVGDVRVSLCSTIDDYLERMFSAGNFDSVVIDLCEADGIDSTTLGLMARLALRARQQYGFKPIIYSCDAGINRLLQSMAFGKLFDIRHETCDQPDGIAEVPTVIGDEAAVKAKVIEAHRVLMGLSEENEERFKDLMVVLQDS